jgi:hypothetical protein
MTIMPTCGGFGNGRRDRADCPQANSSLQFLPTGMRGLVDTGDRAV